MNKAAKKRWVEALRSGEYKQGKNKLHSKGGRFCCLGVLCDIEIDGNWVYDSSSECYSIMDGEKHEFPFDIRKKYLTYDQQCKLISMNDTGDNFDKIADWIEENI
jgi:hypothetical protein